MTTTTMTITVATQQPIAKTDILQQQYRDLYARWLEQACKDLPITHYRGPNKQEEDVLQLVFNVQILAIYKDNNRLADLLHWLALGTMPDLNLTKVILEVDLSQCCRFMMINHKVNKMWQDEFKTFENEVWLAGCEQIDINNWIFANPEPLWIEKIDVLCPKTVSLTEAQY